MASESGTPLPDLYDRVFPKATNADFSAMQAIMETTYGERREVRDQKTGKAEIVWSDQQKWLVFKSLAQEKGWSGKRLEAQIKNFMTRHVYKEWKPADIFAVQASKMYPYSWYVEQCREGNARFIEAYKVPGVKGLMYRLADGRTVPFERVDLPHKDLGAND